MSSGIVGIAALISVLNVIRCALTILFISDLSTLSCGRDVPPKFITIVVSDVLGGAMILLRIFIYDFCKFLLYISIFFFVVNSLQIPFLRSENISVTEYALAPSSASNWSSLFIVLVLNRRLSTLSCIFPMV